ncbi:MAG: sugar kinase [Anaerolineae bacterium]|nr:sugar kinase [Anaerolineae bacterium]
MPDLITLGETMVLLSPLSEGPLQYVYHFEKRYAGAESNVAVATVRLGRSAGWIGRLGDDDFGRYILASLRGEGVDTALVRLDPDHPTGVFFRSRRSLGGGSETFYYRYGSAASYLSPDDLDPAYFRGARVLHLTGITPALSAGCRAATYRAIELARQEGLLISFDPNIRLKLWTPEEARPVLLDLAARADVVLPGRSECGILWGTDDEAAAACACLQAGARVVVVKLGAEGAYVRSRTEEVRVPAVPVGRVVDPVGAGDGFAAGFLVGQMEGWSPAESARLACTVGAFATATPGDVEGYPTMAQVRAFWSGQTARER